MSTLRIFIPVDWLETKQALPWVLLDASSHLLREGVDEAKSLPAASETEIIVAAELVSFIPANLPAGNRKKVLSALPFIIEDSMMMPPEQVHVVVSQMIGSNEAVLATIDKKYLSNLINTLQKNGISPQRVLPVQLIPELPTNGWSVIIEDQNGFLRKNTSSGLPFELDDQSLPPLALQLAIRQARDQQQPPESLYFYGAKQIDLNAWESTLGIECNSVPNDWRISKNSTDMNFLQGEFAPPSVGWAWLIQAKPALIMLALLGLLELVGVCIDWAHKSHQQKMLDETMNQLFKSTFPEATTIVDAPLQMERKYAEIKHASGETGGEDFLPMLANISSRIGNLNQIGIKAIDFETGKLTLKLQAPTATDAQNMLQRMSSIGLITTLENVKPSANGVDFQLIVKNR